MNKCREDFEKWAKSEGLYLTQDKYGYVLPNTAAAWEAWCHLSCAEREAGWRSGYPEYDGDGGVCHIPLSGHPDFMVVAFNSDGNLVDSCGDDVGYSLEDVERWRPIDTTPTKGEEIHVNVDGDSVYTLPLEPTGMEAPRFVVHVPAPDEREIAARALDEFRTGPLRSACLSYCWDTESDAYIVDRMLDEEATLLRSGEDD